MDWRICAASVLFTTSHIPTLWWEPETRIFFFIPPSASSFDSSSVSCFCLIPLSPSLNPACLTVVSHLFRFGMVIKHLWHRRFDSQGETEAWDPWESCLLFYIISIYRRTNVLVLQEHDWPVSRQHAPSKHRSSSHYCHCRTPKRACPLHFWLLSSSSSSSSFTYKNSIPVNDLTPSFLMSVLCWVCI